MEKDIKLLIAAHKPVTLPKSNLFYGIQVGQNFDLKTLPKDSNIFCKDSDIADTISDKNWFYCELTAQYYAYKALSADYFGLMHYRRFFAFTPVKPKHSYTGLIVHKKWTDKAFQKFKIDDYSMQKTITQYDAIVPMPFYYSMNLYQHFGMNHDIQALNIALKILYKKYPHMWKDAKAYLKQDYGYFCNMFIFKNEIFQEYSAWLFDILFAMEAKWKEKCKQSFTNTPNNARLGGYVAELLCGIYIHHLLLHGKYKILKLPIVYFDKKYSFKKKLAGILCPVFSKRRKLLDNFIHKRIAKNRKKSQKS